MDPISIMMGTVSLIGLGTSIFGGMQQHKGAEQLAAAQKNIVGLEQQEDQVRRTAMEVASRRSQLEVIRRNQQAQSQALATATGQGAQYGSALAGAQASIQGTSLTNLVGLQQNLASGEQMFDINAQISQQRIAEINAQTTMNTGQGLSQLGAGIMGAAGPSSKMFGNLFGGGGGSSVGGWSPVPGGLTFD